MEILTAGFVFLWILFSFLVGMASSGKEGGFWAIFIASLLLSPVIGLIIGLILPKKKPQEVTIAQGYSTADELEKLQKLLDEETISKKEFEKEKRKILK